MTLMGAFASYLLKAAMQRATSLMDLVFGLRFITGGGLYFISAVIDIFLLRYLPYVVVLPATALTYVWSTLIAWKLLDERITRAKVVGLSLIVAGTILVVV